MTMAVFCENPGLTLANEIAAEYKNGVIGYAGRADRELFKLLEERGNTVKTGDYFDDHVRIVIGNGRYEEIIKARKAASGKRLFLITDIIDKICFATLNPIWDTRTAFQAPEKVFYSYRHTKQSSASAYATLLAMLVNCLDAAANRKGTESFFRLASHIVTLMDMPLDLTYCARLVTNCCDIFAHTSGGLLDSLSLGIMGMPLTADTVFFTNYLVLAAFIRFTKYDFNGIFIGKDRTFLKNAKTAVPKNANTDLSLTFMDCLRDVLKDEKALSGYVKRYLWESGQKRITAPASATIFKNILENEECVKDRGLLAALCQIGLIEQFR